jgi:hypothetical protein
MDVKLGYRPTEKQSLFHASAADEVLLGGAAGGGKSLAIMMEAVLKCAETAGAVAYVFRRTYRELDDVLVPVIKRFVPRALGVYENTSRTLRLANGSQVRLRHCFTQGDQYRYQGAEINYLFIDELTHFTKDVYDFLKSRLRASKALAIRPCVRCTSNPGGIGHAWVKQYFVDAGADGRREMVVYSGLTKQKRRRRIQYISALVTDNPHIGDDYIFELEQKPKALRDALLYGLWNAFEGQVFAEWKDDAAHYEDGLYTHVIAPFDIPKGWPRFRSFDFGYAKPFSVLWWTVGYDDTVYLYREWYGAAAPNEGLKLNAREIGRRIREMEKAAGEEVTGFADPSIYDGSRGESIADQLAAEGVYFFPGENARLAGKMQFHYRLALNEEGKPGMYVFLNCREFIRCIPSLAYDPFRVEDVDTRGEDHCYDAARYFLMSRPIPPVRTERKRRVFDPLAEEKPCRDDFMSL